MPLSAIVCGVVTMSTSLRAVTMRKTGSICFLRFSVKPAIPPCSVPVAERSTARMGKTCSNIFSIRLDRQHKAWRRHRGPKRRPGA